MCKIIYYYCGIYKGGKILRSYALRMPGMRRLKDGAAIRFVYNV